MAPPAMGGIHDGLCVEGCYYSRDSSRWRQTTPRSESCTGTWKTALIGSVPFEAGVRLVRGDGQYPTLPCRKVLPGAAFRVEGGPRCGAAVLGGFSAGAWIGPIRNREATSRESRLA
jgi:hypothetical protein